MMSGIDCATKLTEQSARRLKSQGVDAVGRYIGPAESWKTITRGEAEAIQRAGCRIFSIWETRPTRRAYFTEEQGKKDAEKAARYAGQIGQPEASPIFFTVDYDAAPDDFGVIRAYFQAIRSRSQKYRIGIYGSFRMIEDLRGKGLADFYYQTYAWSFGHESRHADIYQYQNNRMLAGIPVDLDRIRNPSAVWGPARSAVKHPAVSPAAVVPYPGHLIRRGSRGRDVVRTQNAVGAVPDGIFGPKTEQAVRAYQRRHGLVADGLVGPVTWHVLF
ncbi:glycoside hydrolase domain-containing protein [Sporolactobacillus sp. Y61]|uniref:Glycoside hydrolase domain-containing protein n=1 Tax=Sporolactobacillus sp. Y61 TaxID=3160863 RepID=A0AAU8IIX2_9BACL